MIEQAYARHGHVNVLDVGGTQRYWKILPAAYLASRRVSITLLNTTPVRQPRYRHSAHSVPMAVT